MGSRKRQVKRSSIHRSLVHHSHSGRLVHHKHTHYPTLVFLMLLCGVLLAGMTSVVRAADIQVRATVLGDPPPYAAVITKPTDGQRFSSIPIDIEGTCPPDSIVKIFRNDVFSGSAVCSASNTFALQSDLFVGKNTLKARVFNFADVEGPASDPVVVYYDKPAETPPTSTGLSQLFLVSEALYRAFFVGQEISWPVEIGGGLQPYAVSVDWGDGESDVLTLTKAGEFKITHTYAELGEYKGSYRVVIKASDSQGAKAYLEVVIIVSDIRQATSTTTVTSEDMDSLTFWGNLYRQILFMWPIYITSLLMVSSFWLGQRQGYNNLWNRLFNKTRRPH